MHTAMQEATSRGSIFGIPFGPIQQYLVLEVRRNNLVNDTINELTKCASSDLKKPLKVRFFYSYTIKLFYWFPDAEDIDKLDLIFRLNFMARKLKMQAEYEKNFSCCCWKKFLILSMGCLLIIKKPDQFGSLRYHLKNKECIFWLVSYSLIVLLE